MMLSIKNMDNKNWQKMENRKWKILEFGVLNQDSSFKFPALKFESRNWKFEKLCGHFYGPVWDLQTL